MWRLWSSLNFFHPPLSVRPWIAQLYSAGPRIGYSGIRVPVEARNFFLRHRVQTGSGAHPASYPNGYQGLFPLGVKRPGCEADYSPLATVEVGNAWSYTCTPTIRLLPSSFCYPQQFMENVSLRFPLNINTRPKEVRVKAPVVIYIWELSLIKIINLIFVWTHSSRTLNEHFKCVWGKVISVRIYTPTRTRNNPQQLTRNKSVVSNGITMNHFLDDIYNLISSILFISQFNFNRRGLLTIWEFPLAPEIEKRTQNVI
jgi:hypothetical protein